MILDEKRHVIMPLLDELRIYNHSIGSYDKSMFTDSFDYSVKLSNGLIRLPMELVDDYEKNPNGIKPDRFKSAALNFVPSKPAITSFAPIAEQLPQKQIEKKGNNVLIKVVGAVIIIIIVILFIKQTQQRDIENTAQLKQEKVVEAAKTAIRKNIRSYVTASSSTYNYQPIGGLSNLKITVTNNTGYTLNNVIVHIAYIKQDSGIYKYEEMNFYNIAPHFAMTLNAPDSDRGAHIQYDIEKISSSQLGLY